MLVPVDAVVDGGAIVAAAVYRQLTQRRRSRSLVAGGAEALTIGPKHLGVTGYRHRSDYTNGECHPDNLESLAAVLQEKLKQAQVRSGPPGAPDLQMAMDESILTVGGPVWDGITRSFLGYHRAVDESDPVGRPRYASDGLSLALPYRFDLDQDRISGRALRFIRSGNGISVEEEPNWGIIGIDGQRYYPTVGHDGFLRTYYLILTKIPNLLADPTQGSERFFVNYAGTHGVGQRGVGLLLSRQNLIASIVEDLRIDVDRVSTWPEAYQVVLRLGDIVHDPKRVSAARDIRLVHTARIDESSDWWDNWRREATTRWATEALS